jgi:hypothetical protein
MGRVEEHLGFAVCFDVFVKGTPSLFEGFALHFFDVLAKNVESHDGNDYKANY